MLVRRFVIELRRDSLSDVLSGRDSQTAADSDDESLDAVFAEFGGKLDESDLAMKDVPSRRRSKVSSRS